VTHPIDLKGEVADEMDVALADDGRSDIATRVTRDSRLDE